MFNAFARYVDATLEHGGTVARALTMALAVGIAPVVSGCATDGSGYQSGAYQQSQEAFPALMEGGGRPEIQPIAPGRVALRNDEPPGTILVDNANKKLYYTLGPNEAYAYPISVGRDGFTWTGTEKISRVADWPDWYPPEEMRQRDPKLPVKMLGGIKNPLGVKALFLGNTLYRIHGTNDAKTIGYAASSGCFRMLNEHVVHLASLAGVGTTVKVLPSVARPQEPVAEDLPWRGSTVAVRKASRSF